MVHFLQILVSNTSMHKRFIATRESCPALWTLMVIAVLPPQIDAMAAIYMLARKHNRIFHGFFKADTTSFFLFKAGAYHFLRRYHLPYLYW
jgi:hypothetical protein